MSTALDIITGSLTKIGQLGAGQTVSAEDSALGLRRLNLIINKWQIQRLYLYYVSIRMYQLLSGTSQASIGPSGTFTGVRPNFIESAQVNVSGGTWLPMSIIDKRQWDAIISKNALADIPLKMYPEYNYPNVVLYFNPAPFGVVNIKLGCWEPLNQFATIFDTVNFPPGYETALEDALAPSLAPYYDQPITPQLVADADDAIAAIMRINAQGMGGALGPDQTLQSPNLGQPQPSQPAQPPPAGPPPGGAQ